MANRLLTIAFAATALLCLLGGAAASADGQKNPAVVARILKYHNDLRAQHGTPPLRWSGVLAKSAQTWTNQCIFGHNIAALRSAGYGENVAMGFSTFDDAVKAWLAEGSLYNYNNPGFSDATGHFTQAIWKSTTQVGCANTNTCSGGKMYSCRYFPAGNYIGAFAQNVLPVRG